MAKAGKTAVAKTNLRFLRSGLTIQSHVAVAGEVIPLPSGFTPRTEEEQLKSYGVVHYELSSDPVNVGPAAVVPFVRAPEPTTPSGRPEPEAQGVAGYSEIKRGGGAATTEPGVLRPHAPDVETIPGYENKEVLRALRREKKEEVAAGDLSAPVTKSTETETVPTRSRKTSSHKNDVIILRRKPIKKKKVLVAAKPTRMQKRRK